MSLLNILAAVLFLVLGFLVKKSPYLIAGFSKLSDAQKSTLDEGGFIQFIHYSLLALAALNAGYFLLSYFFGWDKTTGDSFFKYSTIAMAVFMFFFSKKFAHTKSR